jgi:parallel beta-helix repeat protein
MTITSWDRATNQRAVDHGDGRSYIRAVGGRMDLLNVRVKSLGFWSGRTGGVAWTGINSKPSTGSAVGSTFTDNTYGAFVARSSGVQFKDDLFEGNELDGLRLHRNAINSTVAFSASARNGGNGFVVSRGATGNRLMNDLAVNNAGNGFLLNGLPLVNGASPSGDTAVASVGTIVEDSDAEGNTRTGILVEGGAGTIVRRNIVCGAVTGIAIRGGATSTMVVGNEVRCGGRIGLAVGPSVTGTTVEGNLVSDARIGLLIRNSAGVRIINNRFAGITVFGVSVRGASPGVVGNDNVIGGRGFQPIDVRGGAENPTMVSTNTSNWSHRTSLTLLAELRYHPILDTWLVILVLIALLTIATRFRKRPARPYYYTVPWRPAGAHANGDGLLQAVVMTNSAVLAEPVVQEEATA